MNEESFDFNPDIEVRPTYYCTFLVFKFPYTDEKIKIIIHTKSSDKLDSLRKEIEDFMDKLIHKYR